jgi:two-component system sensor histidine kinase/response regulator
MPRMDGVAATKQIRALPQHARTPILAMTANAFSEDRQSCLEAGMNGHVPKPVEPAVLYAELARWLPDRAAAAEATPPASPRAVPASPPALAGLDTTMAMRYFGDRVDVYRRVLRQFVAQYDPSLSRLALQPGAAGTADALRQVHSIKAAAATIGAVRLPQLAERLEQALTGSTDQADLAAAAQAVQDELQLLVTAIRSDTREDAPLPVPTGVALTCDALDRLEQLLESADYHALAAFREIHTALQQQHGIAVQDIAAAMREFDYGAALVALRRLRAAALA